MIVDAFITLITFGAIVVVALPIAYLINKYTNLAERLF